MSIMHGIGDKQIKCIIGIISKYVFEEKTIKKYYEYIRNAVNYYMCNKHEYCKINLSLCNLNTGKYVFQEKLNKYCQYDRDVINYFIFNIPEYYKMNL